MNNLYKEMVRKPGDLCFEVNLESDKGLTMTDLSFALKFFVYGHPKNVCIHKDDLKVVEGKYYAVLNEHGFVNGVLFCEAEIVETINGINRIVSVRSNTGYMIGNCCRPSVDTSSCAHGYSLSLYKVEYVPQPIDPNPEEDQLIAEELFGERLSLPELTADRAIADEHGNRIADTYETRQAVRNHIRAVYNEQFNENPPLIMDGYITPQMLSESTKELLENTGQDITNVPDGEDLTTKQGVLKLSDKPYNPGAYSGMGRVYLRKNLVGGQNLLTQSMVSKPNTIYIIQYDYTLDGKSITIPEGCVLDFQGGSLSNGIIIGNNTVIKAELVNIFSLDMNFSGSWNVAETYPEWFGAKGNGIVDDSMSIEKAASIKKDNFSVIRLSNSKYLVKRGVNVDNAIIYGVGNGSDYYIDIKDKTRVSCIIASDDFPENEFVITSTGGLRIENVQFLGYSKSETWSKANCIKCSRAYINNCNITNFRIGINSSGISKIEYSNIQLCNRFGIYLNGQGDSRIIGCEISYCGVRRYPGSEQTPDSVVPETNYYGVGVFLQGGNSQIINCLIDWNCTGVWLNDAHGAIINNNRFHHNAGRHIFIKSFGANNTTIVGNKFLGGSFKKCQELDSFSGIVYNRADAKSEASHLTISSNNFKVGDWTAKDTTSDMMENPTNLTGPNFAIDIASWGYNDTFNLVGNNFKNSGLDKYIIARGYTIELILDEGITPEDINYNQVSTIKLAGNIPNYKLTENNNLSYLKGIDAYNNDAKIGIKAFTDLILNKSFKFIDKYVGEIGLIKLIDFSAKWTRKSAIIIGNYNQYPFLIQIGAYYQENSISCHINQIGLPNIVKVYTKGNSVYAKLSIQATEPHNIYIASMSNYELNAGTIDESYIEVENYNSIGINRPHNVIKGTLFFDTTLNKPIWWTGTKWVDATGTEV